MNAQRKTWLTTGRRVLLSFGSLVALLALSAFVASHSVERVGQTLHEVALREQRVRKVLQLATAVRDQYAHQAHMILLRDDSHLPMYERSRSTVRALVERLQGFDPAIERIAELSARLDRVLRQRILPAVRAGDDAAAREAHGPALELVMRVQAEADALASRLEADIRRFENEANATQERFFWLVVAVLLSAVAFASIVGLYIGRSVAGPVAALQAGAERLAQGDMDTRIELPRRDEFGRLAEQWNAMTEALRTKQRELVQSERLAGVGRLAAGVAHEINNPLGVILGYVKVLRKDGCDKDAEELRIIAEETHRCKEIVDGLLDLARPWRVDGDSVDLRELSEIVVSRLDESGLAEGIEFEVRGEAKVRANERGLTQVLTNLVRNAVEAADEARRAGGDPRPGRVELALERRGADVRIDVLDNGPGISPAQRDSLFQPFSTSKPSGTGLGLAVCDAIVRAHGGRIDVENRPDGGARVSVVLTEGAT